jgi:NTP pyrophosphatase (non-canonical NTP hydrolase)
MTDSPVINDLDDLRRELALFAARREWDRFHTPKNLSMALIAEAAELVEHFQWVTEKESCHLDEGRKAEIRLELADILIYLARLADRLDIDLLQAAADKIGINEKRYPAHKVKGSARRAGEYD